MIIRRENNNIQNYFSTSSSQEQLLFAPTNFSSY